jgi:divinyl protochlorophyllide a 8-vinyl-reductase
MNRIGPNAILQLVPVLDEVLGPRHRDELLAAAGIACLPDGTSMVDEVPVARLHQALRRRWPGEAADIAARAGRGTGDYILANRIPGAAKRILKVLPAGLRARVLARAIAKHAWTFAGSGRFRVVSADPPVFEIARNPVVRNEHAPAPICVWHAQVFERLYRALVADDYRATETDCGAVHGEVCRFALTRLGQPG